MSEFTLLKLQVEDASFTANAPFSGAGGSESESDDGTGGVGDDSETGDESESTDSGRRLLPLLVGLVFLVVVAVVVKKLRGDSGE